MSFLAALFGLKTAGEGVKKDIGWWLRFKAWQKERDARVAEKATKVGAVLLAVALSVSCKTLSDLSQYCYERPWECGAVTPPPRATPTMVVITPTATVIPTLSPSPTASATVGVMWVEPDRCFGTTGPGPAFRQQVIAAQDAYCPSHPSHCNPEGRRVLHGWENDYYDFVVAHLVAGGLEAWVDVCGGVGRCGEIQVAAGGTKFLTGWAEGWHVLNGGSGDLDIGNYRGRCEPKWWTSAADGVGVSVPSPTSAPSATPTMVAMLPPTLSHFNGCNPPTAAGSCEFAPWFKLELPPDRKRPPCSPEQCPAFWRPSGMALTCDHMFAADSGSPAGVYEPSVDRTVTLLWYVCGGRKWDDPRGPELFTAFPTHCDRPGFRRGDLYNASCYPKGGTVTVCAYADAYACADPKDYLDHDVTYNPDKPGCASGKIALPGAGTCVGPFPVTR